MSNIEQHIWGITPEGEAVVIYTITNLSRANIKLCNIGAVILSLTICDTNGDSSDIIVGQDDWKSYLKDYRGGDFARQIWESSVEGDRVVFGLYSQEEGNGNLRLEISYTLSDEGDFEILTMAQSDTDTTIDLSNPTHAELARKRKDSIEVLSNHPETEISKITLQAGETYVNKAIYRLNVEL